MFESIKIYLNEEIDIEKLSMQLVEYGYRLSKRVSEEGDFSRLGDNLTVYPLTFEYPIRIELSENRVERIRSLDLLTFNVIEDHNACIILPIRGIAKTKISRSCAAYGERSTLDNFIDIEVGDYVVHLDHGIGKYLGMEKLKIDKRYVDHFVIEYAGNNKLYVPFTDLGNIQKYLGFEKRPPKPNRLGTKLWHRTKEAAKKGVERIALDLLELQARRMSIEGFRFSQDTDWQKQLEASFPYRETPDQARATMEVKRDMESPRPMDRLLCGDVGYGKTEVALRAAFKALMDNKQVAILVPTTILAEQHCDTFANRMKNFPVKIDMLSRFRTRHEQEAIIEGVRSGAIDIIIGTHRLISGDIKFNDLALIIIDEEQRFGVRHKEFLKKLRATVDVLTLTATPIPRTLYLALMGGRDISTINTPPLERHAVETKITYYDESVIREAILREKSRGGQIFFVHNRIDGIDKVAKAITKLVPEVKVGVGHGQMSEKILEDVMIKFIRGELDCLVSTTIIESGIDIPNANTIIINRADTLGLADLYQLRGRVGRFTKQAYAYLLIPKKAVLSGESEKRLQAIKRFQELGSGFKLAMEDLQIRGAGNILGMEQHGYINAVGFDLYCRLLKSAIESSKK
ncbi:MAG: transcription-repair coupling factor [Omnitrophica bacterium RIFCSPLOWO2_01_FULL_45_10]|nr:MAG: transcription-repair coupling factor [Omnitrophica bacterium RIFCSPLOWO2_01_FULL_45_10]